MTETLTLAKMQATIAEFRKKFPAPDVWIYGVEIGPPPFSGPLGASYAELLRFVVDGLVMLEDKRWYWTPKGRQLMERAEEQEQP